MTTQLPTSARQISRDLAVKAGFLPGSSLEDLVSHRLGRFGWKPGPDRALRQQFPVGRYRLDYAWPEVKIALEADGWHHRSPDGAARDAHRDAALREQGWITFRVHEGDTLAAQLARVSEIVRALGVRW